MQLHGCRRQPKCVGADRRDLVQSLSRKIERVPVRVRENGRRDHGMNVQVVAVTVCNENGRLHAVLAQEVESVPPDPNGVRGHGLPFLGRVVRVRWISKGCRVGGREAHDQVDIPVSWPSSPDAGLQAPTHSGPGQIFWYTPDSRT